MVPSDPVDVVTVLIELFAVFSELKGVFEEQLLVLVEIALVNRFGSKLIINKQVDGKCHKSYTSQNAEEQPSYERCDEDHMFTFSGFDVVKSKRLPIFVKVKWIFIV